MKQKTLLNANIPELSAIAASVIFCAAMFTFLKPGCGAEMHCHEACRAVQILSVCMAAGALSQLFLSGRILKMAADGILAILSVTAALIPGTFMSLCMMPDMSCRTVMKPGITVFCVIIAAAVLTDLILKAVKNPA